MSKLAGNLAEHLEAHVRNVDEQYRNAKVGKAE